MSPAQREAAQELNNHHCRVFEVYSQPAAMSVVHDLQIRAGNAAGDADVDAGVDLYVYAGAAGAAEASQKLEWSDWDVSKTHHAGPIVTGWTQRVRPVGMYLAVTLQNHFVRDLEDDTGSSSP